MDIYDVNTCYPAKVISFDPVTQTISCKVSVEDYYTDLSYDYTKQPAPVLTDVPVVLQQGGGWDITFPIKPDDDCLLLFAQKGYDHWLYDDLQESGMVDGIPASDQYRHFDIRDAVAIVGLRPIPRAIKNYNNDGMELRNEARTQRITFNSNGTIDVSTTADVNVHCVNASVSASKTALITTPDMTIDSPITKLTGNLSVAGSLNVAGGGAKASESVITGNFKLNGNMTATGTLTGSDCIGGGKKLKSHTHTAKGATAVTSGPN